MEHANVIGGKNNRRVTVRSLVCRVTTKLSKVWGGGIHLITLGLRSSKDAFPLSSSMKRNLDKLRPGGLIAEHIKAKFPPRFFLIISLRGGTAATKRQFFCQRPIRVSVQPVPFNLYFILMTSLAGTAQSAERMLHAPNRPGFEYRW